MQNFIVLGYIPGTQIQITFMMWLYAVITAGVVYLLMFMIVHRQPLINVLVYFALRRVFRRPRALYL